MIYGSIIPRRMLEIPLINIWWADISFIKVAFERDFNSFHNSVANSAQKSHKKKEKRKKNFCLMKKKEEIFHSDAIKMWKRKRKKKEYGESLEGCKLKWGDDK